MSETAALRPDPWAKTWRTLASGRLLLVCAVALALMGLIALWFPQAPRSAFHQDDGLDAWLSTVRPQLGSSADTLLALGLLSVVRSVWIRVVLLVTTLSLLVKAYDAIQWIVGSGLPREYAHSARLRIAQNPSVVLDKVRDQLSVGFSVRTADDRDHGLTAHRPSAYFGPLGLLLGCLLMIGGWLVGQTAGWEVSDVFLTEETPGMVAPTDTTLSLEDLDVDWGISGRPNSVSARLILGDGLAGHAGQVTLDHAWRWQGVTYRLLDVGPSLRVSGSRADGEALMLQTAAHRPPVPDLIFMLHAGGESRSFAAPEVGVVVQVEAASPTDDFGVHLRIYQGQAGELVEDRLVSAGRSIVLGESELNFDVIPFAQVKASHTPGRFLIVLGASMVVAGAAAALAYRPRHLEVVATADGDETNLALAVTHPADLPWLETLISQLDQIPSGDNDGG